MPGRAFPLWLSIYCLPVTQCYLCSKVETRISNTRLLVLSTICLMPKILVDCGNCSPDFNSISRMAISSFGAKVIQTHGAEDTLKVLRGQSVDLVTVNRKLDRDYTDGMEVIKQIKADPQLSSIPVMLVTNYEEHQQIAIDAGCVRGFGKLAINDGATKERLEPFLG